MKVQIPVALSILFATVSTQADLASYQSTVNGQSPSYYFTFDNTLVDSVGGSATLTPNGSPTFGSDYFGNANDAESFPASTDYLTGSSSIVSGSGTSTAVGSLSLLFYVPDAIPGTGYYFSDSETTSGAANGQTADSAFTLQFTSSTLTLKVGNKSTALPTPTVDTWYYIAVTYSFGGTAASDNYSCYLGALGGTLSTIAVTPISASASTVGDGLGFVVGNKQDAITGTPPGTAGVADGGIDELATWNTALSSSQVTAQFNALTVVPEPSSLALCALGGGLCLLGLRRKSSSFPK
jgi:PEP-CTERM motif